MVQSRNDPTLDPSLCRQNTPSSCCMASHYQNMNPQHSRFWYYKYISQATLKFRGRMLRFCGVGCNPDKRRTYETFWLILQSRKHKERTLDSQRMPCPGSCLIPSSTATSSVSKVTQNSSPLHPSLLLRCRKPFPFIPLHYPRPPRDSRWIWT